MRIPARQSIIDRANDQRADAVHQHDPVTVRQLDTLIGNLHKGMKMKWNDAGNLMVTSANSAGAVYTVDAQTCSCPAFKPCNHMRLRDIILAIQATDVESADIAALA